jgi:hypothetical protein
MMASGISPRHRPDIRAHLTRGSCSDAEQLFIRKANGLTGVGELSVKAQRQALF